MAEWAATEFVNCIDVILKGDMKFGQALKKFKVDLKARTPKYQRFCRYVKKLQKAKKQEESKILLCCMLCCNWPFLLFCCEICSTGKRAILKLKRFTKKEESMRELKRLANQAQLQANQAEKRAQEVERQAKNQLAR